MNRVKEIICAKHVYESGYTGKNVTVALLDTGVDVFHPDLKDKVVCFRDYVNKREPCYDDNGHGTHIAGIICGMGTNSMGKYAGLAPGAKILAMKVLDRYGNGSTENVLKALEFIRNNAKKYNVRILNFSIGYLPGAGNREQERLIHMLEELWDMGIVVVTAAGNNGPGENTVTVPGISRKLLTVGSMDDQKNSYSGKGPTTCCIVKPEILAPGTDIISTKNDHKGYFSKTGTSMAAPIVCGACALLIERKPEITPEEIKVYLYDSVTPLKKEDHRKSWGILNVDQLIRSAI